MATRENRYIIRLAGEADGAGLTGLFAQLGYPNPDGAVSARLAQPDPAREVLVALWEGLPVRGVSSALVVDEGARGGGIGALLLAAAEQRAAALGCGQLELSSSLKREGAHRFYLAQGYCERPKRFVKAV